MKMLHIFIISKILELSFIILFLFFSVWHFKHIDDNKELISFNCDTEIIFL